MIRRRVIDLEREYTREAARGVCDPSALIQHAETRAVGLSGEYVTDPMLIADRDRIREVREELADARNHLVWWLEQHHDHETARDKMIVLRLICIAYDRLGE